MLGRSLGASARTVWAYGRDEQGRGRVINMWDMILKGRHRASEARNGAPPRGSRCTADELTFWTDMELRRGQRDAALRTVAWKLSTRDDARPTGPVRPKGVSGCEVRAEVDFRLIAAICGSRGASGPLLLWQLRGRVLMASGGLRVTWFPPCGPRSTHAKRMMKMRCPGCDDEASRCGL